MTTHSFTGFRVTTSGGTPATFAASTMSLQVSEFFRFQYTMDAAANGAFSSITMNLVSPSRLFTASVGSTRVDLNAAASVGEYTWGGGNTTTVMAIQISATETHYFAMAGDPLPAMSNLAAYNSFMASVTGTTSDISSNTSKFGPFRPGGLKVLNDMSKTLAYTASSEDDAVTLVSGVDDYSASPLSVGLGNDTVTGTSGVDWVRGGIGADSLVGLNGNDRLFGEDGNDTLLGGNNDDELAGGKGNDSLQGDGGNDTMSGGTGADTLRGGSGNDSMRGDGANDLMYGDAGNDTMLGGSGNDTLAGGTNDDILRGDGGADSLFGEAGNDTIRGGSGDDVLEGGDGADFLDGGLNNDVILGGIGDDTIVGNAGADTIGGDAGNDSIRGGSGDDMIDGGADNDFIDGGSGNDLVVGDIGNDTVYGGSGDDTVVGGAGDDQLYGGIGSDAFVFEGTIGTNIVNDFRVDQGDVLAFEDAFGVDAAAVFALAAQDGRNVVFDFGAAGSVTVRNTTLDVIENVITVYDGDVGFGG